MTTSTTTTTGRLLVTGASGQLGQAVLTHLLDTLQIPPSQIIGASRSPDKLEAFADRGVTIRRFDFDDAASMETAALGVDRVLLISGNDMHARLAGHKAAVTALVAAGVQHLLFTSFPNVDNATIFMQRDFVETEAFIRDSGVPGYTLLGNGLYFENDLFAIAIAKRTGKWASAAGNGKVAAISRDELALANAAALASNNYANQRYEFTGTTGLTIEDITHNISKVMDTPIEVAHLSSDELVQHLVATTGMPEVYAQAMTAMDGNTAQGFAEPRANDFKTLVGRDPQTHVAWLEANAAVLQAL